MGIKTFAVVSDGMMIQPIQSFKTYSQKLARIQRKLSLKKREAATGRKQELWHLKHTKRLAESGRTFYTKLQAI
jgi:hypothetical protein